MGLKFFSKSRSDAEAESKLRAIDRSQAVIEFDLDGRILSANENFLNAMGYQREEVVGRHHSMFVDPADKESQEYKNFWASLRRGEFQAAEYRRVGKNGREVWIQASYNPILNEHGKPFKVIKFATDVTAQKNLTADYECQIKAIDRSDAVIEFDLDGTVLRANANFLSLMGYRLDEVVGKHHSIFVEAGAADSREYKEAWRKLRSGHFLSGEFRRVRKDGGAVWIKATYSPIQDATGKPYKVVKIAKDISKEKRKNADYEGQIKAIQRSQAVIEFELDGTILWANDNFLTVMGYRLEEVQGRHHSIFVDESERKGEEYRKFWEELNSGEFHSAVYRRIAKDGREVWIQASYNPIKRPSGKLVKVVKFATDVTRDVMARKQAEHIQSLLEETATGAEQLSGSVRDIASSVEQSRSVSNEAVHEVTQVDMSAKRLGEAAQSMSGIVGTINDIADQINLLALNATIEAARAGEAGKGFAVVAGEVKSLANQTQSATKEIRDEISNMLAVSTDVAGALDTIRARIESVQELVATSASAVEEQSSVSNTMSSNMRRAVQEAKTFNL